MKKVYISLSADYLHPRDLKVIEKACSLGQLIVGLFTDSAFFIMGKPHTFYYDEKKKSLKKEPSLFMNQLKI